ncbi:thiamine diphosphokinase [Brevibacillus laterosporus]|uniref:thiamine diphosphokinase n=2 Tax=Brevibacillus laterosporus TaxID=1465 RepID=UPI000E6B623F|nr:thiamine diphosphokinase [Brevibacillus laterosporus]AYB37173.1 thiamine diphosphokinase [Brevibacillus laterosporus]MBM7109194.1 Thiamine pyrophosphokinase [Brevibacillus laterosporus]
MIDFTIHICTGGYLDMLPQMEREDLLIGVDGGAIALLEGGMIPHIAVGDFDTIQEEGLRLLQEAGIAIKKFSAMKNATDTEIAVEIAMEAAREHLRDLGSTLDSEDGVVHLYPAHRFKIVMYGAVGSRLDHSLANLSLLKKAHLEGVWMEIVNRHNRVMLLSDHFPSVNLRGHSGEFLSLVPASLEVTGINLTGFAYPLTDATIPFGSSIGVSNEWANEYGKIERASGDLFVIAARDR